MSTEMENRPPITTMGCKDLNSTKSVGSDPNGKDLGILDLNVISEQQKLLYPDANDTEEGCFVTSLTYSKVLENASLSVYSTHFSKGVVDMERGSVYKIPEDEERRLLDLAIRSKFDPWGTDFMFLDSSFSSQTTTTNSSQNF